jgi:hypothetical protein
MVKETVIFLKARAVKNAEEKEMHVKLCMVSSQTVMRMIRITSTFVSKLRILRVGEGICGVQVTWAEVQKWQYESTN